MRTSLLGLLSLLLSVVPAAAQTSSPDEGDLVRVVALFRHGVRAPTEDFGENADKHSANAWPTLDQWGVGGKDQLGHHWGYLTNHGRDIAVKLGRYYGMHYQSQFKGPMSVFLWADIDQRTQETARGLEEGLKGKGSGIKDVVTKSLPAGTKVDLLFHPFEGRCGKPGKMTLLKIADDINTQWQSWEDQHRTQFAQVYATLGCNDAAGCKFTDPDAATICVEPAEKCGQPILWKGRFSYASQASEAFLLEYANGMPVDQVGWNRVSPPNGAAKSKMTTMLQLHEFYFDKTQRQHDVAQIEGSNLVKEIQATLNAKVDGCQRAPRGSSFVGLVGHDTNQAAVGALLGLKWEFPYTSTGVIPANDLLPAGAVVFEVRRRKSGAEYVRVAYVTQALNQMRNLDSRVMRLNVGCVSVSKVYLRVCEMPLSDFNEIANRVVDTHFVSRCVNGQPVCAGASPGK